MFFLKKALVVMTVLLSITVIAQESSSEQQIFYKWYENGIAHYAKTRPRVTDEYERINQYGMVLKDRPNIDSFQVIRPTQSNMDDENTDNELNNNANQEIEGVITKEQRCDMMKEELDALTTKEDIYQEDESGNLIPLDEAEVAERAERLQASIEEVCEN